MKQLIKLSALFVLSLFGLSVTADDGISFSGKTVYVFDLKKEIGPSTWRTTTQSIDRAVDMNADLIIIHMNTYGGMLDAADSIRTKIINCPIPVYVFIDNNAISAGALISIAANKIYMREGAIIGAATVVNQTGDVVPDKYQAVMRGMMRSTAESHGKDTIIVGRDTTFRWRRDPQIAEAMVDPSISIIGVIDATKVLTLTAEEAIRLRYCEGKAERIEDVLAINNITEYQIVRHELTALERVIHFLINPYLQSVLIMLIVGGIYFELQSPGIGFPLAVSITAASLYFAPLYIEGLANHWELLIFFAGLILIGIEIFALPGFGVAGISGIFLMVFGLSLAMVDNIVFEWDFSAGLLAIFKSTCIVVGSSLLAMVLSIRLGKSFLENPRLKAVMLTAEQRSSEGYVSFDDLSYLTGAIGTARSMLRPAGKIDIDGTLYDAICEIGYIDAGDQIRVIRFETGQLYVIKN